MVHAPYSWCMHFTVGACMVHAPTLPVGLVKLFSAIKFRWAGPKEVFLLLLFIVIGLKEIIICGEPVKEVTVRQVCVLSVNSGIQLFTQLLLRKTAYNSGSKLDISRNVLTSVLNNVCG